MNRRRLPNPKTAVARARPVLLKIATKLSSISPRLRVLSRTTWGSVLLQSSALPAYYRLSDLMWQDGLLVDFLQKKTADKWVRKFLVITSYLFSERVLFTLITRLYTDAVAWPSSLFSVFEFSSVSITLNVTLVTLASLVALFNLNFLYAVLL